MAHVAGMLRPVVDRTAVLVRQSKVIHTDATKMPYLDPAVKGKTLSGQRGDFVGDRDHPFDVFAFCRDHTAAAIDAFLQANAYRGYLSADAHNLYDHLFADGAIVERGCRAHCRRHFYDAKESDPARAHVALARIRRRYEVEAAARKQVADQERSGAAADAVRLQLRREKTLPEVTALRQWSEAERPKVLPKSLRGQAIAYALRHWQALTRYLDDGFFGQRQQRRRAHAAAYRQRSQEPVVRRQCQGRPDGGHVVQRDIESSPARRRRVRLSARHPAAAGSRAATGAGAAAGLAARPPAAAGRGRDGQHLTHLLFGVARPRFRPPTSVHKPRSRRRHPPRCRPPCARFGPYNCVGQLEMLWHVFGLPLLVVQGIEAVADQLVEVGTPMNCYVGTSGYSNPKWQGTSYPKKLPTKQLLRFYGAQFRTVEVNYTFRRLPTASVLKGWTDAVAADFQFVLKAPERITHRLRLPDAADAVANFLDVAAQFKERLGPLLFQLPANFHKDVPRLRSFLALLPRQRRVTFAFRHPSWFDDEVFALLRRRRIALTIADAEGDLAVPAVATTDWGYWRLRRPD
jgi:uncharacterized protein YecE (DUF72 family)